jgi:hypothetical protein
VAGSTNEGFGIHPLKITRLNANGTIDKDYGENGTLSDSFDQGNDTTKLLIGADGKLTVVGTASEYHDLASPYPIRVYIARYNANGSPDPTFTRVLIEDTQYAYDARLTSDGGVLLLAHGRDQREFKLIRYKANGTLDSAKVLHSAADINQAFFDKDGSILLMTADSTVRLAEDGSTKATGAAIATLTYMEPGDSYPSTAIAIITADHKLLVAGEDADGDLMLSRYLLD